MASQFDTRESPTPCIHNTVNLPEPALHKASQALRIRRAAARGMATAEYAVGILAAVALALVLLNIFNDNAFFEQMLKMVINLIGKVGEMIG